MNLKLLLALLFSVFLIGSVASAQQSLRDQGIIKYKQGDDAGAIDLLEKAIKQPAFKDDAETWNALGLAYLGKQADRKARKALETAVKLKSDVSIYHANLAYAYLIGHELEKSQRACSKALQLDPKNSFAIYVNAVRHYWKGELDDSLADLDKVFPLRPGFGPAYLAKSDVLMSKFGKRVQEHQNVRAEIDLLSQSVETLEKGILSAETFEDRKSLSDELDSIKWFYLYFKNKPAGPIAPPDTPAPNITPLKITYQPRANYTDSARAAGASGAVRLAIHLGANGKVLHILKLWGIGYGLDQEAIKAAKAIKFEPKLVDGKPVSVVIIREYTFSIG